MPRKRSTYTAEFELSAVKMILDQKRSVAEAARRLGVSENRLHAWKKAVATDGANAFPGHGNPTPAEGELRRLRAENARLRAERDLLERFQVIRSDSGVISALKNRRCMLGEPLRIT
ncbi:transposase [Gemmata sp. JC673]|uniref:Transposase n=1 Tax=Gemmata algarum TaxID=2975278 RepID=A0ABU5EVY4_9BACT|nr:transposase [Gemmata algarum]MDY3558630.1 transposase [Gemmata algarum]